MCVITRVAALEHKLMSYRMHAALLLVLPRRSQVPNLARVPSRSPGCQLPAFAAFAINLKQIVHRRSDCLGASNRESWAMQRDQSQLTSILPAAFNSSGSKSAAGGGTSGNSNGSRPGSPYEIVDSYSLCPPDLPGSAVALQDRADLSRPEKAETAPAERRKNKSEYNSDTKDRQRLPEWLKEVISKPDEPKKPHDGDVFWHLTGSAKKSGSSAAFELSYPSFALRTFTLTRESTKDPERKEVQCHGIFHLKSAFESDFRHFCDSSESLKLQICIRRQARKNEIEKEVSDIKTKVGNVGNFHEHVDIFMKMLQEQNPDNSSVSGHLQTIGSILKEINPSSFEASNFELLSCSCIFQCLWRFLKHNYPELYKENESGMDSEDDEDDGASVAASIKSADDESSADYKEKEIVDLGKFLAGLDALVTKLKDAFDSNAGTPKPDLNPEGVSNHKPVTGSDPKPKNDSYQKLINSPKAKAFMHLLEYLVYKTPSNCYLSNGGNAARIEHSNLAFRVLERIILESVYFTEQDKIIERLSRELNEAATNVRIDQETKIKEKLEHICMVVAVEQLQFAFQMFDATIGAQRPLTAVHDDCDCDVWLDLKGDVLQAILYEDDSMKTVQDVQHFKLYERLCNFACVLVCSFSKHHACTHVLFTGMRPRDECLPWEDGDMSPPVLIWLGAWCAEDAANIEKLGERGE